MAYTTIDNGSEHFNTVLWSGDGNTNRTISGVGFQPDWTWIKRRSSTYSHALLDSNRGGGKALGSDNTDAENTNNNILSSWNSDGFVIALSGVSAFSNTSGQTYVGWNWKANGGTTSSNTDGTITSTVQANTTAGFSIVTYTGTGSASTIGHGLGSTPDAFFVKSRTNAETWRCWFNSFNGGNNIRLDNTAAVETDTNVWNNSLPTSTLLNLGSSGSSNGSSQTYVAYCFHSVKGYSKIGKYTGNGSTNGTFVYTGFRPAFVLFKQSSGTEWWGIIDATRDSVNQGDKYLKASDSVAEGTGLNFDLLSNGIKFRHADAAFNGSGSTYIYMAFAEHPFVSSKGVPVTAR